ncbi:PorP/SprF family type IX secretion system membrane protein [Prevotella denticola]|uniref:PorP/SprF family type IX secretion system membrane protein n=1 Tax=Prevotella denticola TaxID=28129 RepID=UPI0002013C15|nr:type IX secretion system membrane protein PorP/SprF [Prevotella denticola]AEA20125.1 Bacteroidetes-specific putative membrane protein [Prevotella denticola F0289]QUB88478.1 type IX secretion system membrane protein PorP/SprF [Prevotella denticola]
MLKRLIFIIALACLAEASVKAQYDPSYSHYWAMEPSFNPASVGKDNKLNVVGAYGLDFSGYEHNPNTFYVGADMPLYFLKQYHGVGISILNDKLGVFTHQRISVQYAFRHHLFGGMLSAGVQSGMLFEKFDGSKLDPEEASDPALTQSEVNGNSLDFGAGLYYTHRNWYVGASVQHLNSPLVELGETNELQVNRTYYLTGGYNIKLRNPFLTIPVSALVRYDGTAYRTDLTARVVYSHEKRMLYGGVSYSPTNSVTAFVGGTFHGINVGYSYEMYTGTTAFKNGSHGLFVSYQTDINLQKKGRNKHKSVRFL